jgi:hypothetical protein
MTDSLPSADGPLSHVLRVRPPWRSTEKTECGRAANDVAAVVSREEARAMVKRWGQRRAAFLLCQTCSQGHYPASWWAEPAGVLARDVTKSWAAEKSEVADELRALGQLVEAHREEFEALLTGVREGHALEEARAARARREAAARQGPPPGPIRRPPRS